MSWSSTARDGDNGKIGADASPVRRGSPFSLRKTVSRLSPEQLATFESTFKLYDADGSGRIDGEEIATVMRTLGMNLTQTEVRPTLFNSCGRPLIAMSFVGE